MTKEIRSSATGDPTTVANKKRMQEDIKKSEPPDPKRNTAFQPDLEDNQPDSMSREAKWIDSMHGPDGPVLEDPNATSKD